MKNKIELWDDLVICEHGKHLTSVFWHSNKCPTQKEWTWVKYVTPISPWDDLNKYKESIKVSLGADNEQSQANCVFIPQLDPKFPAIQEVYANKMQ